MGARCVRILGAQDELNSHRARMRPPPRGVEKVRDNFLPLYRKYNKEADCRVELFDCEHVELPEMRKLILEWMDRYLVPGAVGPRV